MKNINIINFINKIEVTPTCWNWKGSIHSGGYGSLKVKKILLTSHRYSYEYFIDKIPSKMTIDHICKNKICVNPLHLRILSLKDNILASDNPAAINSRKKICIRGHKLSGKNLRIDKKGHRACINCINFHSRLVKSRKKLGGAIKSQSKPSKDGSN